jgi:hypothetical protein
MRLLLEKLDLPSLQAGMTVMVSSNKDSMFIACDIGILSK